MRLKRREGGGKKKKKFHFTTALQLNAAPALSSKRPNEQVLLTMLYSHAVVGHVIFKYIYIENKKFSNVLIL